MSGGVQQSLVFLRLPDLKKLVCVTLSLQEEDEDARSKQIQTCRELLLLFSELLASPALDSFTDITVVMAIPFFQRGILQAFGRRRGLQLGCPQPAFPGDLQRCVSYSLITRLAPGWNKAGRYLISGKDFLTEGGRLNAVSLELSTREGQLCISVEASAVRLPPPKLEDFDLPPLVLRRFCSDPGSVLDPTSTGGALWCHVLPSMKKGQIVSISRQLPRDGPFRTYRELQNHWSRLYGYRLPELPEQEEVYCSVYFRPLGRKLFTYPLSCIRLQPAQRCPRVDLQGALGSFLADVGARLQTVCGFPARLSSKPCYHTVSLSAAASVQVLDGEHINLTTSVSIRPVLAQLPAPPPAQPRRPSCGPQPPAWAPLSQQGGAPGHGCGCQSRVSRGWGGDGGSVLPLLRPASSLTSSSVLPPPPPVQPPPKLVPVFKNKHPSHHVNVALLRLQEQSEQLGRAAARVTLPAFRKTTPAAAPPLPPPPLPPRAASSLPVRPPPTVPNFSRRPKVTHISSLSPALKPKLGLIIVPKPEIKIRSKSSSKPTTQVGSEGETVAGKMQECPTEQQQPAAPPAPSADVSKKLSRLSSATLLVWLKARGASVGGKHRKEDLMLKVMGCLAEG
ncbi:uncharacterized protein C18orf63 homolog [Stegastes partitus]|uniref:Uncharacterized protein C18orf63 homolog n=1 Tax=Stegastes partitus TaxID=144197 RepID=A0A9Y4MYU5_9TELE|nr:PREDICTED: uncharacterized protein C18orf63 homolog [Stegastes partitus]